MRTTTLSEAQSHYDNLTPPDDYDPMDCISDYEYRKLSRKIAREEWESIIEYVLESTDLLPAFEAGPVTLGSTFFAAITEQIDRRIVDQLNASNRDD